MARRPGLCAARQRPSCPDLRPGIAHRRGGGWRVSPSDRRSLAAVAVALVPASAVAAPAPLLAVAKLPVGEVFDSAGLDDEPVVHGGDAGDPRHGGLGGLAL